MPNQTHENPLLQVTEKAKNRLIQNEKERANGEYSMLDSEEFIALIQQRTNEPHKIKNTTLDELFPK